MAINEDLISRRALHSAGYEVYRKFCRDRDARNAMNELEKLIKDAPAVDAVPVVHGRWLDFTRKRNGLDICYVRCMVCGKERGFDYGLNYCPNCGAKMDGGVE